MLDVLDFEAVSVLEHGADRVVELVDGVVGCDGAVVGGDAGERVLDFDPASGFEVPVRG